MNRFEDERIQMMKVSKNGSIKWWTYLKDEQIQMMDVFKWWKYQRMEVSNDGSIKEWKYQMMCKDDEFIDTFIYKLMKSL